jgi:hypothetical protein
MKLTAYLSGDTISGICIAFKYIWILCLFHKSNFPTNFEPTFQLGWSTKNYTFCGSCYLVYHSLLLPQQQRQGTLLFLTIYGYSSFSKSPYFLILVYYFYLGFAKTSKLHCLYTHLMFMLDHLTVQTYIMVQSVVIAPKIS